MTASADLARWAVAPRRIAWAAIGIAALGFWLALPPVESRSILWPVLLGAIAAACGTWAALQGEPKVGWGAVASRRHLRRPRHRRDPFQRGTPRRRVHDLVRLGGRRLGTDDRADVRLRDPGRLCVGRRDVLRAKRRREHRARGDDAERLLLRHSRRRQARLVGVGSPDCDGVRRRVRTDPRLLRRANAGRPDRRRHRDQLPRTRASRGTSSSRSTGRTGHRVPGSRRFRTSSSTSSTTSRRARPGTRASGTRRSAT